MNHELLDELSLRPLRRCDVDALVAIGYGTRTDTAAMVEAAVHAADRGDARPMVIVRRCLAPDPRTFNGLRVMPLVLGVISDIGDVWMADDPTPATPAEAQPTA